MNLAPLDDLKNVWDENLGKIEKINKLLNSGTLSIEDQKRAAADQNKLWGSISQAQESYNKSLDHGANAADRYAESASAFLDNVTAGIAQMEDALTGGSEKQTLRVDKWFEQQFDAIRKAVLGAKGDVTAYAEAWGLLLEKWQGVHDLAASKDLAAMLEKQADLMREIGQASGDAGMVYQADLKAAEAWYNDKKKLIEDAFTDEEQRAQALAELQTGLSLKKLEAERDAYEGLKGVSSKYWEAEKALIEEHLEAVKKNADDETAYKIYAAEKWNEFREAQLQNEIKYATSFGDMLKAKVSLHYGLYKDEATRARETWADLSDSIISGVDDLTGAVAGGVGDMIRGLADGSTSMEDVWKSMLSSMLDAVASFVEAVIKKFLELYVVEPLMESLFGSTANSANSALGAISGSGSGSGGGSLNSLLTKATSSGVEKGLESFVSGAGAATSAVSSSLTGGFNATSTSALNFADSVLNPGLGAGGGFAGSGLASGLSLSTVVTGLGIIAGIAGLALGSGLFGGGETKTEQTGTGYTTMFANGESTSWAWNSYRETTSGMGGAKSVSHYKTYSALTPDQEAEIDEMFSVYTDNMLGAFETLGFGKASTALGEFSFPPFDWTSDQEDTVVKNINNAKMMSALGSEDILYEFATAMNMTSLAGEDLYDGLVALTKSFQTVEGAAHFYGLNLEKMASISGDIAADAETLANRWGRSLPGQAGTGEATDLIQARADTDALTQLALGGAGGMFGLALAMNQNNTLVGYTGAGGSSAQSTALTDLTSAATTSPGAAGEPTGEYDPSQLDENFDYTGWVEGYVKENVTDTLTEAADATNQALEDASEEVESYAYQEMNADYLADMVNLWQATYAQQVMDAFDGDEEAVTAAYKRFADNTQSQLETLRYNIDYYRDKIEETLTDMGAENLTRGELDDFIGRFWTEYENMMSAGYVDPATFAQFDAMATWVESLEEANTSIEELGGSLDTLAGIADAVDATLAGLTDEFSDSRSTLASWLTSFEKEWGNLTDYTSDIISEYQAERTTMGALNAKSSLASWLSGFDEDQIDASLTTSWLRGIEDKGLSYLTAARGVVADTSVIDAMETSFRDVVEAYVSTAEENGSILTDEVVANLQEALDGLVESVDGLATSIDGIDASMAGKRQAIIDARMDQEMDDWASKVRDITMTDTEQWAADFKDQAAYFIEAAGTLKVSETELAKVREWEATILKDKVQSVMDSVESQWDDVFLTEGEKWVRDLSDAMQQAYDDAVALGAAESDLARIREVEAEIIADKLASYMDTVEGELAGYEGTELEYNLKGLNEDMAGALYDAALLGADEAQLERVGLLYAYKIKDAYQAELDDLSSKLSTAAASMKSFADSLKEFLEGLWVEDTVSPLGLADRYAEARRQYQATVADLGSSDDETKADAQANIEEHTRNFLELSKLANADFSAYYADFMSVQSTLGAEYANARTQLDVMEDQLKALGKIEDKTTDLAETQARIDELLAAQNESWTAILEEMPDAIAEAIMKAQEYKDKLAAEQAAGSGGGSGGTQGVYGNYGSSTSWDQAYVSNVNSYFAALADELNASGYSGQIGPDMGTVAAGQWLPEQVAAAIQAVGLSPYQHYQTYGQSQLYGSGSGYVWSGPAGSSASIQVSSSGITYPGGTFASADNIAPSTGGSTANFNEAAYYANKAEQLNAIGYGGQTWTAASAQAAVEAAGLTAQEHYALYGAAEGVTPYAAGGDISAGALALVGEQGPELVRFQDPVRIYSNAASRTMAAAANADQVAELAALKREQARTNRLLEDIAKSCKNSSETWEKIDAIGLAARA